MDRLFRIAHCWALAVVASLILLIVGGTCAQGATLPPAQQHGLDWLTAQVQANGSLAGENASVATPLQAREESVVTLAQAPSTLVAAVGANNDGNVEYIGRRIIGAATVKQSDSADILALLAAQNADGGWGLSPPATNPALAMLVGEYDKRLRNASHHRWLR